ncbi:MAG: hypothetical protein KF767_00825 [Bdellovibrionaceae bacterium]|nr:hypothetical protein [Pseudobdellovibrionaceae bacterium]
MECVSCLDPKAKLECGLCGASVCKSCAQFMDDDAFAFLSPKPTSLAHDTYCPGCYDREVATALAEYEAKLARARELPLYLKKQSRETKFVVRKADPIAVKECPDHDETLLRLAFQALEMGYNALVDVQLHSTKIRPGNYQTTIWDGVGIPVNLDPERMPKDRAFWDNPN